METEKTEKMFQIPDNIADVDENILNETLACEACFKNYKLIKQELSFLKVQHLPVPHLCPNCRHKNRMSLRTPRKLWKRKCFKCACDIETSYSPERPEKVYCEKCYLEDLY